MMTRTMTQKKAQIFAQEWIAAWNSHDLERVLAHYTDDFEMSSPFIVEFTGEPTGTLRGKDRARDYWRISLERIPDLHFELLQVLTGASSLTIYYKAVLGKIGAEVLFANEDGKVFKAMAHYDSW